MVRRHHTSVGGSAARARVPGPHRCRRSAAECRAPCTRSTQLSALGSAGSPRPPADAGTRNAGHRLPRPALARSATVRQAAHKRRHPPDPPESAPRASRARKASRSKPHGCAPPPPRSAPPAFRRHGPCARAKAPDHPACGCRARADRAPPPTRRHRIRPVARPDIEQQRARGGFQQHRAALPHVQRRQPPVSRLGPLGTPAQQRQHPEPPMAPRPASRLQGPGHARQRQQQPGPGRGRHVEAGPGRPPTQATGIMVRSNTASPACPPRQPGVPRPESPRTTRTAGTGA